MDKKFKDRAFEKLIKTKLPKHRAWQLGTGHINMHATHPLADMKPREQFLVALDRVTPEVKTSLDELSLLYKQAYTILKEDYSGPNELGDWDEVRYLAQHVEHHNREYEALFADLKSRLESWAGRWFLAEAYWRTAPTWVLDWAIHYLRRAPQNNVALDTMDTGFKEYLSKVEKKLVIEEDVREYALKPWIRDEYIKSTVTGWKRKLENHLEQMERRMDDIHGGPVEKRSVEHFDWVVLRQVCRYSAETIANALTVSVTTVQEALNSCASDSLLSLTFGTLPKGGGNREPHKKEEDIRRRLKLS